MSDEGNDQLYDLVLIENLLKSKGKKKWLKKHEANYAMLCVYSSGYSIHKVVWCGGRLQRNGDGATWSQSGGPFQLLLSPFHHEDGSYASRPGS